MKQEGNIMHRKFKILAVAPYESLKEVLLQTAKEYPQLDVTVEVGPTPFVKIQQPLLFWWFYITSAL